MKHPDHINEELKKISPLLAELEKTNIFSVPVDYFLLLDFRILEKIKDHIAYRLPASEPFVLTVPEGYFENLAGNILSKIKNTDSDAVDELKQLSPTLFAAKNKNVFTIPTGYFENVDDSILKVVQPQAKVVVMKKRSIIWNCAAAAVLTGVMAISALWVNDFSSLQNPDVAGLNNMSSDTPGIFEYKNEQQVNKGIADLSETDIIGYLETTGSQADDELLASVIQEKELPAEQDYLTDDNTLENFFKVKDLPGDQN